MSETNKHSEEYDAVEETLAVERAMIAGGLCPFCGHELEETCEEVSVGDDDDVLYVTQKYCPHCGWEGDEYYD